MQTIYQIQISATLENNRIKKSTKYKSKDKFIRRHNYVAFFAQKDKNVLTFFKLSSLREKLLNIPTLLFIQGKGNSQRKNKAFEIPVVYYHRSLKQCYALK